MALYTAIKTTEDIVLATIILILISPVTLIIAMAIKIDSKGPVIFKQKRGGINNTEIIVYKFRSMTTQDNGSVVKQASKNDPRTTSVGKFLRKTSLDELPQFINVIQGTMSIVGPRPHAVAHDLEYGKLIPEYSQRFLVKPGITGLAQINGWRGQTDTLDKMKKRINMDLKYINRWTLWLDIKIIFITIWKGFNSKNTYFEKFQNRNVVGYIPGKTDEWIVFTAHYDGMGMYGNVLFPGANDNGSGTVMVVDLARHYATSKKSKYSVAVVLCAGEEAGLHGSRYFADNPLLPLENVRMVINLDMVASGQTGVTLFNGLTWPKETEMIQRINKEVDAFSKIRVVGPAANSDHHPFHLKGVPALFFITSGKVGPGHTAFDYAKDSHFPRYDQMFTLITDFIDQLPGTPEPVRYPLIDYHVHLKGDMTYEMALEKSRKSGIQYGIAVNCGLGFPVNDDAGALAFLESMKDSPFMLAMQAEGREWISTFSKKVIRQFDYVFTDAMTYTDENGKRVRLWIPDEVEVGDPEVFMDDLVGRIVKIISTEPIDIYVNPTFLPTVIADQYDALWTPERMDRVIAAAKKHRVAIEINNRYRIPSETFIKRAKDQGVKFAFGTNNTDSKMGDLNYCREMVTKCGLVASDIWKL